jgi:predicted nucleic acid-binding protein
VAAFLAEHEDETLVVSTISLQELAIGEVLVGDASLAAIVGALGAFDVRGYTVEHAYAAAVIEAELRDAGDYEPALARDVLIGGVARARSNPVVTRNDEHFARFDGVAVETY